MREPPVTQAEIEADQRACAEIESGLLAFELDPRNFTRAMREASRRPPPRRRLTRTNLRV